MTTRSGSIPRLGVLLGALTLLTSAACAGAPYKRGDPPAGLVSVASWKGHDRLKGGDDGGVNISSFENREGGTLAFWSADLVNKLGRRGYELVGQRSVKSKNGIEGTRFDFDYTSPATDERKFFTAVLFVTDRWRVVVQVAGDIERRVAYEQPTRELVEDLRIRGCKLGTKICRGPQPTALSGAATAKASSEADPSAATEASETPADASGAPAEASGAPDQ